MTRQEWIASLGAHAQASQRATGVPASVTLAQAILESYWGMSGLARTANNFFGIKGRGPAGSVRMRTHEVVNGKRVAVMADFAAYHSPEESFTEHGQFFVRNPRYATAMRYRHDPFRFAAEIHRAGYATDPKYTAKLHSLMRRYDLTRYDAPDMTRPDTVEYIVQPGDTLLGLASRYGTTVDAIRSLNGIRDVNRIQIGQRLHIPRP